MAKSIMFTYPDKESCEYLESLGLSYTEMIPYFECIIDAGTIRRTFKKLGITHKGKRDSIREAVIKDTLEGKSQAYINKKYNVSKRTISRIRKEYYDNNKSE